jgi:glycosyltransferase involved in cell wall biosynthesis
MPNLIRLPSLNGHVDASRSGIIRYWGSHFKSRRQVTHWLELFRPLTRRGWRGCLVLERLPEESTATEEFQKAGVELVCLRRPHRKFDFDCVRAVYRLCRRFRTAVFHCENIHTSPMLGASMARVPVRIWQKHAMSGHFEEGRLPTFKERLAPSVRLSCALATRVLAVSRAVAQELSASGITERKILLRNNPRTSMPQESTVTRDTARQAFGLDAADVAFVTLGHAVPVKGWDLLLNGFVKVSQEIPRAKLIFAGSYSAPGEVAFHRALLGTIQQHNLEERVVFTGHVENIAAVLRAADVFVSPSRSEGFSYALIEALEEGLPCIAARVGIAPEVIRDRENGFLFEPGDSLGLEHALRKLSRSSDVREACGRAAAVPPWIPSLGEYAEQLARDYEELLAGRAKDELLRQAA